MNTTAKSEVDEAALHAPHPLNGVALCLMTSILAELVFKNFFAHWNVGAAFGRLAIVFVTLYAIHRYALAGLKRYRVDLKELLLLHFVLAGTLGTVALGRFLALALTSYVGAWESAKGVSVTSLYFAIPFAMGGLLLRTLLGGLHRALVFTLSLAVLMVVYLPDPMLFVPYVVVTNFAACLSLVKLRSRSAYIRAGINITVVSLVFVLASALITSHFSAVDLAVKLAGAVAGGVLCSFIVAGVTPIVEHLGGYVTDIRLIEMATLDHPLLKELSIQAPGTWNHSMVIGMMVEAAADVIGANPVLARVGAYFHDIGKVRKPIYFVENQGVSENRHDKLSSSMSALIIRSHVKDGMELARKHKVPEVIVNMIPEHHGTSLIEYFYDKACKEAEESGQGGEVDRSLYAYPGPKPQSREAALLMLADGIEAASRTIPEPTPDRIQGLVQKMINKVFTSGELDECELTLKDLHEIAKCFTRVLTGIHHQRIAYAEPAEKVSERPAAKGTDAQKEGSRDEKEDLKRLGL